MKKLSTILVLCSIILLTACTTSPATTFSNPDQTPVPTDDLSLDSDILVRGTIVCLPKKNPGEMQTMECTMGIKTSDGTHYGLNLSDEDKISIQTDQEYAVVGTLREVPDSIYEIKGLIDVNELQQ